MRRIFGSIEVFHQVRHQVARVNVGGIASLGNTINDQYLVKVPSYLKAARLSLEILVERVRRRAVHIDLTRNRGDLFFSVIKQRQTLKPKVP